MVIEPTKANFKCENAFGLFLQESEKAILNHSMVWRLLMWNKMLKINQIYILLINFQYLYPTDLSQNESCPQDSLQ